MTSSIRISANPDILPFTVSVNAFVTEAGPKGEGRLHQGGGRSAAGSDQRQHVAVNEFLARLHPFREEPNATWAAVEFSLASMELFGDPGEGICELMAGNVGKGRRDTTTQHAGIGGKDSGVKRLRHVFRRVREWAEHWFVPPYLTVVVEETLPAQLVRRTVYFVREDGFDEQVALLCPCGCGRILHMNLLPDERPCWSVTWPLHEAGRHRLWHRAPG